MKKKVFGRQFKRDTNERKALFKGLMSSLVLHERIQTTSEKAKAIKGTVEKLVTKVKKHKGESERFLHEYLTPPAILKMMADTALRFEKRPGGYARIIRLEKRITDSASQVILEWVEKAGVQKTDDGKQTLPAGRQESQDRSQKKTELKKPAKRVRKAVKK